MARIKENKGLWLALALFFALPLLLRLLPSPRQEGFFPGPRVAVAAGETVFFIPAAAMATGAAGTNWRTDLELVNVGTTQASYTIALLKRDSDNSNPQTRSYTLEPGRAVRYTNVLSSVFGTSGAAALRLSVTAGSLLASSRTYNLMTQGNPLDLPAGATFGQFVPAFTASAATTPNEAAYLIQLTHTPNPFTNQKEGFRTNIGYVNTTNTTIALTVDLYDANGTKLGSFNDSLSPYGYKQVDKAFERVTSQPVSDGYAIVRSSTPNTAFFTYASVVDNVVGDPIFVPGQKGGTSPPSPTPTPSPTRTPTPPPGPTPTPTPPPGARVNLLPYKASGWDSPVVPSMEQGTHTVSVLSVNYNTYVDWAVLNEGPDDIPGRINFELRLDGQRLQGWYTNGLQAHYYVYVEDYVIPYGTLSPGYHTLSIVADYDNQVAESNEGDNTWSGRWEWQNIFFAVGDPRASGASRSAPGPVPQLKVRPVASSPLEPLDSPTFATAGETLFIPAAAMATGAAGTNWRTDLELVNVGTTQASYTIALLKRDSDNSNPQTRSYTLEPGRAVRYTNVLSSVFGTSGAAALRLSVTAGSLLASSRTYNLMTQGNPLDLPAGATFGQFVPAFTASAATTPNEAAYLIQLTHTPNPFTNQKEGFRTNIGYVNTTNTTIALTVDLYDANGTKLGSFNDSLSPYGYKQVDKAFERVTSQPVSDGYAIVRSSTPNTAFFTYASVIDNITGDPVFVTPQRVTSTQPPGPTPTPTPLPTAPISVAQVANEVMEVLSRAGSNGRRTFEDEVKSLQTEGIDGYINELVQRKPSVLSKISNGVRADWGSGVTLTDGSVLSGSATITYANPVVTATRVQGTLNVNVANIRLSGGVPQIPNVTVTGDLATDADHHVTGTVSISGSAQTPQGPASISGSLQVDTKQCAKYPASGTITITRAGKTSTIRFDRGCTGTYSFGGDDVAFGEVYPFKEASDCNGRSGVVSPGAYLIQEGQRITFDSSCYWEPANPQFWQITGTVSGDSVTLRFRYYLPRNRYIADGTFISSRRESATRWWGTSRYTITFLDSSGNAICTTPVMTKDEVDVTLGLPNRCD